MRTIPFQAAWFMGGLWFLAAASACACSCVAYPEDALRAVEIAYEQADVVFVGEVKSLDDGNAGTLQYLEAVFDVQRSWKGIAAGSTIAIRTSRNSAACGYPFRRSVAYLVFAYRDEVSDSYTTGLCALNLAKKSATQHIHALNELTNDEPGSESAKPSFTDDSGRPPNRL